MLRPDEFHLKPVHIGPAIIAVAALVLLLVVTPGANAATLPSMTLPVGQGQLVRLNRPAASVFVANPEIADVQVNGPRSLLVFGVRTGRTTLYALAEGGQPIIAREVRVQHDLAQYRDILDQ